MHAAMNVSCCARRCYMKKDADRCRQTGGVEGKVTKGNELGGPTKGDGQTNVGGWGRGGKGGKHEIREHNPGINKSYMGGIVQKKKV